MLSADNTVDLFEREQMILDHAVKVGNALREGQSLDSEEYFNLIKEYGRLLKQVRRITKIYDKATETLNMTKLDLMDKVKYDALTGIYNRRYLNENFETIIKKLSEDGGLLSVLMLDIDFFKLYNDTYGHSEGDECLRCVARTISESLTRQDDFVVRYGGEEFVVILPGSGESTARVTANRILENIRALNIAHTRNEAAPCVTISIGMTTAFADRGQAEEEYIRRADEALYRSKKRGRNRYTFIDFKGEI